MGDNENTDVRALLEAHVSRCAQAGSERPMWSGPSLEARDLDRMNLRGVNLEGVDLSWTVLTDTNLLGANLSHVTALQAYFARACLRDVVAHGADLSCANLYGADLRRADLDGARLRGADLREADLREADMNEVSLVGVDLAGATMPDGRTWEAYRADPLAGICHTPEAREAARKAWGGHTWKDCPMHAALGIDGLDDLDDAYLRRSVACFVACHDAGLLPLPGEEER